MALRLPKGLPASKAPFGVPLLAVRRFNGRSFYSVVKRTAGPIPGEGYPPDSDLSTWMLLPSGAGVDAPHECWVLPE